MRIAVDAFPLSNRASSGIPNYVKNVLANLVRIDRENEYFLYSKNPIEFTLEQNVTMRFSNSAKEDSTSYGNTIWLFTNGARMMKRDGIALFWGTRQMLPPLPFGHFKKVLIVYDLVWHYFPETMEGYNRLVSKFLAKSSIKSADHIITISEATARSLTDVLNIEKEKIHVIYPSADRYIPLDKDASAEYISKKYGTSMNYALTLSTVEPRKNLVTLLRLIPGIKNEGVQLLIAGAQGWKSSAIHAEYKKLGLSETDVKFLGYVHEDDMNRLYSGARLFLFPSVYEGFGMPPLEAMACGTPVITSNSSSLPEVTGPAGIFLEPYDVEGWQKAVVRVLSDKSLQHRMILRGIERARLFSWEASARQTLRVFEEYV